MDLNYPARVRTKRRTDEATDEGIGGSDRRGFSPTSSSFVVVSTTTARARVKILARRACGDDGTGYKVDDSLLNIMRFLDL